MKDSFILAPLADSVIIKSFLAKVGPGVHPIEDGFCVNAGFFWNSAAKRFSVLEDLQSAPPQARGFVRIDPISEFPVRIFEEKESGAGRLSNACFLKTARAIWAAIGSSSTPYKHEVTTCILMAFSRVGSVSIPLTERAALILSLIFSSLGEIAPWLLLDEAKTRPVTSSSA